LIAVRAALSVERKNIRERVDLLAHHQFEGCQMGTNRESGHLSGIRGNRWIGAYCLLLMATGYVIRAGDGRHRSNALVRREDFAGKQLFEKSWEPGTPSATGGDGLGPLYNDVSCVACHNQSGTGGGGAGDHDVVLLTAVTDSNRKTRRMGGGMMGSIGSGMARRSKVYHGEMADLHPGFQNSTSVVLHRHATDPAAQELLAAIEDFDAVQTREGFKVLRKGRRNTPALFGAGLIDAISDDVLLATETRTFPNFPEIKGRVSALPDGQRGRFGWKGQIASLDRFVRAACANELGLEVPGHHQASLDAAPDFDPSRLKLDMDEEQCALLTRFLRRLPPPLQRSPDGRTLPPWGYMVFESIGCATCHAPKLGGVSGIYSDLLLHDMGESSADSAVSYGSPVAPRPSLRDLADSKQPARRSGVADATEWRTPPLWGVADSAPYLHDGRAGTLDDAIRKHDGEAAKAAQRYGELARTDRNAVLTFLGSLTVVPERRNPAGSPRARNAPGAGTEGPAGMPGEPPRGARRHIRRSVMTTKSA
jgi:CxxC motif-containing protein (DUF1111 family)